MARTAAGGAIGTANSRLKLAVRAEPYWWAIEPGRAMGYRRLSGDRNGSWFARADRGTLAIEAHIRPHFGAVPLNALAAGQIAKWRDALVMQPPRRRQPRAGVSRPDNVRAAGGCAAGAGRSARPASLATGNREPHRDVP